MSGVIRRLRRFHRFILGFSSDWPSRAKSFAETAKPLFIRSIPIAASRYPQQQPVTTWRLNAKKPRLVETVASLEKILASPAIQTSTQPSGQRSGSPA